MTKKSTNVVFRTSVKGNANLGSWPEAGGATGLAAGDAICNTLAANAGLKGTFVAWLSDDNNDAYCRMFGLTGKKANNCGVANLPAPPGPWVRTDGFPFAGNLDQLLSPNGEVYSPLIYDENGIAANSPVSFITGTTDEGTQQTFNGMTSCSNWTSSYAPTLAYSYGRGYSHETTTAWTAIGGTLCSSQNYLICFQINKTSELPSFTSSGRRVFVTDSTFQGDFGSVAAGDALCQTAAANAGLANAISFKAWLSSSTVNAPDHLVNDGQWVRLDGVKIANSVADLLDGELFTSINVTESLKYLNNVGVWTGTDQNGIKTSDNCSDWANQGSNAILGFANDASGWWTEGSAPFTCGGNAHLYCFEDAP